MNTMRNLTSLSLALMLISSSFACEANNSQGQASAESTAALSKSQKTPYVTKSQARKSLAHSLYRFYGISDCRLDQFKRISIGNAIELISQVNFPEKGQTSVAIQFLENYAAQIVALYGEIETEDGPTTLLRLIYQPSLDNIPDFLGCSDGTLFDLTSIGAASSTFMTAPIPLPRLCKAFLGEQGRCCSGCTLLVYTAMTCGNFPCIHENCCSDGPETNTEAFIDEYCPGFEDYFRNDEDSIETLSIGESLYP